MNKLIRTEKNFGSRFACFADLALPTENIDSHTAGTKCPRQIALTKPAVLHQRLEGVEQGGMPEFVPLLKLLDENDSQLRRSSSGDF